MSEEKELPYQQRGKTECWPFKGARDEAPNKDAKMACDNPTCCNPRHVVQSSPQQENKAPSSGTVTTERAHLTARLDELGVSYRTNASVETLRKQLQDATAHEAEGDA